MPSHEPELYKDKIEVSLDGRQIFYLFFGGAVIVGLVFVLGVVVGRRVEARGHLDRADTQATSDPLAALDRLERSDHLSFRGALTGAEAPTDVEKAIGELEKRRLANPAGKPEAGKPQPAKPDTARPDAARPDAARPDAARPDAARPDAARPDAARPDAARPDAARPDAARSDATRSPAASPTAAEARVGRPEDRSAPAGRTESKSDTRNEPVTRPEADRPKAERDSSKHDGDKHDADKRDSGKHDADKHDADKRDADKHDADRRDADKHDADRRDADRRDADRRDADKHDADKHDTDRRAKKHDDSAEAGHSDAKKSSGKFTLQLSSFQDKSEAEAFLGTIKSAGFQPYLTEAEVTGKGTFYRVRLGSYRSLDAANDAKAEYEKTAKKTAQVMRL